MLLAEDSTLDWRREQRGRDTRIESSVTREVESMRYLEGAVYLAEAGSQIELIYNGAGADLDVTAGRVAELVARAASL